jgi:F-type H+-transporting ATPase subunit epsilon
MADKINLEIVTPRGKALSADADEVTAPGAAGEFGAMPGHVSLLVALRSGIVTYKQGPDSKRCAVGAGFAEVSAAKMTMLVDECVEREAVDPVAVRKDYQEAETQYNALVAKDVVLGENENERRVMVAKLNWLSTQLELCGEAAPALIRLLDEKQRQEDLRTEEANEEESQA